MKRNLTRENAAKKEEERLLEEGPWLSGIQFSHRKEHRYRDKVEKIVSTMERTPTGQLPLQEVCVLFTRLLGVPETSIQGAHEEVRAFAALPHEAQADTLTLMATEAQIDACFVELYPLESYFGPDHEPLDYAQVREEIALEAGCLATTLPRTRTLREVVGKLFLLLLDGEESYI